MAAALLGPDGLEVPAVLPSTLPPLAGATTGFLTDDVEGREILEPWEAWGKMAIIYHGFLNSILKTRNTVMLLKFWIFSQHHYIKELLL